MNSVIKQILKESVFELMLKCNWAMQLDYFWKDC